MHGSLALRHGVVWVGRHAKTARIVPFDLDGAPLGPGFAFRGADGEPASVASLSVDADRRLWVADEAGRSVRVFSAFGRELATLQGERGALASPCAIAVDGLEHETRVLVASGERATRTVEAFTREGDRLCSLRSRGDPERAFDGARAVALRDRFAWVCEARSGWVQVFRDFAFHFTFALTEARGARATPLAVQALADGRVVVAAGGSESSVWLVDRNGRASARIAGHGRETGRVHEPCALAIEEGDADRKTRVFVLDSDADRVQVFTLDGDCYGAFQGLPRS